METIMQNTGALSNSSDEMKSFKKQKIITNFVGLEKELNKFLGSLANEKLSSKVVKSTLHIFPTSCSVVEESVKKALKIFDMMRKLQYECDKVEDELKALGQEVIDDWNNQNPLERVSSVRFVVQDDGSNVLISRKDAFSISQDKIPLLKDVLGDKFGEVFSEKTKYVMKDGKVKDMFLDFMYESFGSAGPDVVFDKETSYSVNQEKLQELLESDLSDEQKVMLQTAVKRHEPAIRYSK